MVETPLVFPGKPKDTIKDGLIVFFSQEL